MLNKSNVLCCTDRVHKQRRDELAKVKYFIFENNIYALF